MLVKILHSQPERLLDRLNTALKPTAGGDEDVIGEMDKLRQLRRRGGFRHGGR